MPSSGPKPPIRPSRHSADFSNESTARDTSCSERWELPQERGGRRRRVVGLGEGTDDDDPSGPGLDDGVHRGGVDAADGEPRTVPGDRRGAAHEFQPGGGPARLGRGGPGRSDAGVVDVGVGQRRVELLGRVRGAPDQDVTPKEAPGRRGRQVPLAEVQHVRDGEGGDVRAVVDGDEPPVPVRGGTEHRQQLELLGGLQTFLPQLHDIDARREDGVQERLEVALAAAGVGAQVQTGAGQGGAPGGGR